MLWLESLVRDGVSNIIFLIGRDLASNFDVELKAMLINPEFFPIKFHLDYKQNQQIQVQRETGGRLETNQIEI